MFLYLVRNAVNGMEYVGTTTRTIATRWSDHRYYGRADGRRTPLYDAIREYGVHNFSIEQLAKASSYEEMLSLEIAEIAKRNTVHPHGYNQVKGGRGNFGWRMKEETRKKIGAAALGRVAWNRGLAHSPEQNAKTSASKLKKNAERRAAGIVNKAWNKGVKFTPEQLENLRRSKNADWKAKQSVAQSGKTLSAETLGKISAAVSAARKQKFWSTRRKSTVANQTGLFQDDMT